MAVEVGLVEVRPRPPAQASSNAPTGLDASFPRNIGHSRQQKSRDKHVLSREKFVGLAGFEPTTP
jgi:hypothetical protein